MISTPSLPSGFCTELSPLRIWGKWQSVRARRRKWDERQHWLAFRGFRTDHEFLLSLRWDQPQQHFVVSSESAEGKPVLAFIPFASSGTDRLPFPPDSQWRKFRAETRWERRRRDHEKQPSITLSQRFRCEKEFKWASP